MNRVSAQKGFTIIEVVLVLAIAGLIFLMVFVAFPALQRNQRDARRQQDMRSLIAGIMNYRTNNGVNWPFNDVGGIVTSTSNIASCGTNSGCIFIRDYMNPSGALENTFVDPDGTAYILSINPSDKQPNDKNLEALDGHTIVIKRGAECQPGAKSSYWNKEGVAANAFVVMYKSEASGIMCLEGQ